MIKQALLSSSFIALAELGLAMNCAPAGANEAEARCQALAGDQFLSLVDAPTEITRARISIDATEVLQDFARVVAQVEPAAVQDVVAEKQKALSRIQPFCRVSGYVQPNVGFELLLPLSHWNGRFLQVGCGGACGADHLFSETVPTCARYGDYACISTDTGHARNDLRWFRNNNLQAQIDFSYRATHVVALAGKAIVGRYYGSAPKKSYFIGCSTGGYQGMVEAQRYPWDFNGIVSGAPDMDESDLAVRSLWVKRHFLDAEGKPSLNRTDIELIHEAALAQCDLDDGVKDGIVSDPMHCRFDPGRLQCSGSKYSRCLSASQIQAVKSIYGAPENSEGKRLSTRGVLPGSELNWADPKWAKYLANSWGDEYFGDTQLLSGPGAPWSYHDFDFDRDYARSGVGVIFPDTNPDLRKFKAAGGKLLSYQGANDVFEFPGAIFDYYDTVEKTMGGRSATQEFFRLFVIPGMGHCTGGEGADAADFLSYLEKWVEGSQAPDRILSGHFKDISPAEAHFRGKPYPYREFPADARQLSFTRPLYPYPLYPKYKGTGSPDRAESFGPSASRSTAAE